MLVDSMVVLALAILLIAVAWMCVALSPWVQKEAFSQVLAKPVFRNPVWKRMSSKSVLVLFLSVLFVIAYLVFSQNFVRPSYLEALAAAPLWASVLLLVAEELFFRVTLSRKLLGGTGQAIVYALVMAFPFSMGFSDYLANFVILAATGLLCSFLLERLGFAVTVAFRLCILAVFLAAGVSSSFLIAALIFLAPFAWLLTERKTPGKSLSELGLVMPGNPVRLVADCAWLLILMILALGLVGAVLSYFGFSDQGSVAALVKQQGGFALLLAVTLGPIGEELLFRGLLSRRYGILASSLAFGLAHYFYGSVLEVVGAVTVGLILAWYTKRTNSTVAPIVAHAAYNALSILVIFGIGI
jgi:membrane protease YdiL (CAAX protease family)